MRVLLSTVINRSYNVMPSVGLGYLAAVLRQKGHEVNMLHCNKEKLTLSSFQKYVEKNEYEVYAFQMYTYDMHPLNEQLKIVKRTYPHSICLVGGYHPSGDPHGVLNDLKQADYAMRSEAEIGLPALLDELSHQRRDLSNVPNLIHRNGDQTILNPVEIVENLDELPFPAWDLMDPNTYPDTPHGGFAKSFPSAPMTITRGCPLHCTFCATRSITPTDRVRSVENVISEMKFLKEQYNVNDFLIEDENITLHKKLLQNFCDTLIKENMNISWSCPAGVRIDMLTREKLDLMEASGCHSLNLGIEFGSQRIHDLARKSLTLEKIKEKMELFKDCNIKTTGFFLFGIPGETREEMEETIKFAKKLPINRAQFNLLMPLPGTAIYEDLKREGKVKELNYNHFFVHDVGYVPEGFTRKQMKWLHRKAYIEFYFRPRIIIETLQSIVTLKQFYWLTKRFADAMH